jgi:hypothetical protein
MEFISNYFYSKIKTVSFEDILHVITDPNTIIINTLSSSEQLCLIKNTVSIDIEENIINEMIKNYDFIKQIIIYGKNNLDMTTDNKFNTLKKLGFKNVFVYRGGLFEWLLLQDIYGCNEFPTNKKILDILKFKPTRTFHTNLLQ